ncbi:uncharacterized protein LOC132630186 [Lycium barbarum]|uniref:uncharacterized protein LOC132630186 n=1 Tax=Lycium barbarum TaxID=112863 RepID=UPI00293E4F50|nr:uncharacterized protein LOC132630186 [Lycium barbarum]
MDLPLIQGVSLTLNDIAGLIQTLSTQYGELSGRLGVMDERFASLQQSVQNNDVRADNLVGGTLPYQRGVGNSMSPSSSSTRLDPRIQLNILVCKEKFHSKNNHGNQRSDERNARGNFDNQERGLNTIKVTLPKFKGSSDPEEFLEWILQSEGIFQVNNISNAMKVKYAITQFEDFATTWWETHKRTREKDGRLPPEDWREMKVLIKKRFVPEYYNEELQKKFYTLQQGNKSVNEYYEEFERIRLRANIEDNNDRNIPRFVAGLNKEISSPMRLHRYFELEEASQAALKVEEGIKEDKIYTPKVPTTSWNKRKDSWKPSSSWDKSKEQKQDFKNQVDKHKPKLESKEGSNKSKFNSPSSIKCFKCQDYGHKMNECPNRRTILAMNGEGYLTDDSDNEEDHEPCDDDFVVESDDHQGEYDTGLVVRRIMQVQFKIMDSTCFLIIDGGSSTNVASAYLVEHLKLSTRNHHTPYRLQWLNNCGELKVTKQVLIKFSIGKYHDEIICDVAPMQACHLLLGRPWKFDRGAKHDGRANKYSFVMNGQKHILNPLTPLQVNEGYKKMRELRERITREDKRTNNKGSKGEKTGNLREEIEINEI